MAVNTQLVEDVLDAIRTEADGLEWRQGSWYDGSVSPDGEPCGTSACFGGHALIVAGEAKVGVHKQTDWPEEDAIVVFLDNEGSIIAEWEIGVRAQSLLGFDDDTANRIFFNFSTDPDEFESAVRSAVRSQLYRESALES